MFNSTENLLLIVRKYKFLVGEILSLSLSFSLSLSCLKSMQAKSRRSIIPDRDCNEGELRYSMRCNVNGHWTNMNSEERIAFEQFNWFKVQGSLFVRLVECSVEIESLVGTRSGF